jgi:hypothetical protein
MLQVKISEEVMKYAVSAVMEETESDLPMNEINAVNVAVDEKELELIEKDIQSENKKGEEKEMKTVVEVIELVEVEAVLNSKQVAAVESAIMEEGKVFETAEDFAAVKGIGPKTVEAIKEELSTKDQAEEETTEEVESNEIEISNDIVDKAIDEIVNVITEDIPKVDKKEKKKVKKMNRKERSRELGPKFFDLDINSESESTVRGVLHKGRYGIEITNFKASVVTNSNRADYNKVILFFGGKEDGWDIWGRYSGKMVKEKNGTKNARFEFYKTGNNVSVTYWRGNKYKKIGKKLATAAINKLYEAYKK